MANLSTLETLPPKEIQDEAAFSNIVDSITRTERLLTPRERAELQQEPVGKPAGYADQGYRHG